MLQLTKTTDEKLIQIRQPTLHNTITIIHERSIRQGIMLIKQVKFNKLNTFLLRHWKWVGCGSHVPLRMHLDKINRRLPGESQNPPEQEKVKLDPYGYEV